MRKKWGDMRYLGSVEEVVDPLVADDISEYTRLPAEPNEEREINAAVRAQQMLIKPPVDTRHLLLFALRLILWAVIHSVSCQSVICSVRQVKMSFSRSVSYLFVFFHFLLAI